MGAEWGIEVQPLVDFNLSSHEDVGLVNQGSTAHLCKKVAYYIETWGQILKNLQ